MTYTTRSQATGDVMSFDDLQLSAQPEPEGDRRRPASGQRVSWASDQPFIDREPTFVLHDGTKSSAATPGRDQWVRRAVVTLMAGDSVAALAAGVLATMISPLAGVGDSVRVLSICLLTWLSAVAVFGGYAHRRIGDGPEEYRAVLHAAVTVVLSLGLVSYLGDVQLPRAAPLAAVLVATTLTGLARHVIRGRLHRQRESGQAGLRTVLVGNLESVLAVRDDLSREPFHGYHVVGACLPRADLTCPDVPVLGAVADVPQVVVDHAADVVIVVGAELSGNPLRRLSWALEQTGADLVVAPGVVEVEGPRLAVRPAAGLSLLHVERPSQRLRVRVGKELLDRSLGLVFLLVAAPAIAIAAIAVSATSSGGPFFRQVRIGRGGKPFSMWKLRSMVQDAETRRDSLIASSDRDGLMFKMHVDPRITRVGAFLRRFSLDELPQLLNVVRGDMSLVGPRPPLESEVAQYHDAVNRRLRVKPGLTGLWQVSGRADLSWEESVRLDLRYVDNWSVTMDLLILWKTARAVVAGSGAY